MKSTSIKTVAVLTSGGDAPGLNAAIRALCVSGKNNYGMKFIGVRNGYRGLIDNDTFKMDNLDFDSMPQQFKDKMIQYFKDNISYILGFDDNTGSILMTDK